MLLAADEARAQQIALRKIWGSKVTMINNLPGQQSIISDKHRVCQYPKIPKLQHMSTQTDVAQTDGPRKARPSPKNSTNENRSSCLCPANFSLRRLTASRTEMQRTVAKNYRFAQIMPHSQTPRSLPAHLLSYSRSSESIVWAIVLYCHVPPSTFLN